MEQNVASTFSPVPSSLTHRRHEPGFHRHHRRPGRQPSACRATRRGSSKVSLDLDREVLDHGGPGYLQFAITNVCNARCEFCGFAVDRFDARQRRSVTWPEAREAIDICQRNQIGYLLFVGGEPLVHRDLPAMVRHAALRGIRPMICTNGSLWTETNMRQLADNGLSSVIMSIDTHEVARHESHRGLPEVCRKIQAANRLFARLGVQTTASITISKLIEDYSKLPGFLTELGFRSCTFSYPLTTSARATSASAIPNSSAIAPMNCWPSSTRSNSSNKTESPSSTPPNRSPKCSATSAAKSNTSAVSAATNTFTSIGISTSTAATIGKRPSAISGTSTAQSYP
jgi:organic radical activating enzyme